MIDIQDPTLYHDWSYEDLDEHIKMLREIQKKKGGFGSHTGRKLSEMLDPATDDFMGSGQTMMEYFQAIELEHLVRSFFRAKRPERTRRLNYIIQLARILSEIEAVNIFATASARRAIEDIIDGDWASLRLAATYDEMVAADFQFLPQEVQDLWAAFRAVCQEAFDTRPGAMPKPAPKN